MKLPALDNGDIRVRDIPVVGDALDSRGTAVLKDITRTILARSFTESSTCQPGNNSPICAKPADTTNTETLPIVLGVVIPISIAICVFIFLHRRNKKRQALEDINDPHKSLDFGLDIDGPLPQSRKPKRGRKGPPEMIITALGPDGMPLGKKTRGLSMDMLGSPYMLPAGLSGSRESLHSMSRSVRDEHDPYRPIIMPRGSSDTSRSPRPFHENASMYSASTTHTGFHDRSNLVVNAQRVSQSYPERSHVLSRTETKTSESAIPAAPLPSDSLSVPPSRRASSSSSSSKPFEVGVAQGSPSPTPLTPEEQPEEEPLSFPLPPPPEPPLPELPVEEARHPPRTSSVYVTNPPRTSSVYVTNPPRKSSMGPGFQMSIDRPMSDTSEYMEEPPPPMPPPKEMVAETDYYEDNEYDYDIDPSMIYTGRHSIDAAASPEEYAMHNNRLSYMGLRPLPPDHPEENAEQRANRIRSFYKEYFDTSRPNPANAYYEDWDADYSGDFYADGWYDPETGEYYAPQAPYAQPMGRRAMTPPPRGAGGPRFAGAHDRHYSTMSAGRGPFRGRPPLKKKLPPPKPLTSLPTPHMLKDDSALLNPIEFAPPTSFREVQNGRGRDSPIGTRRPFSPSVRAFSPLVSAYDQLSPIPSPHALRKSGTFTSLDFSPQVPRFLGRDGGGASDAGSIRSARSGISALQMDAVRSGAYRVSRIPKEFVTSREDLSKQLRPKMDLTSYA